MSEVAQNSIDIRPLQTHPPLLLHTQRLTLRAVQRQDAELLFNLYGCDPDNCRYMSFKSTGQIKDIADFIEQVVRYREGFASTAGYVWVIEKKDSNSPIGSCGIGPKNHYTLEGGYILNSRFWGHGYASEAWKCLVDWAKEQPGVYRVEAHHHVDNTASGRVMKNAGMSFEGVLRRASISPNIGDEPHDSAVYAWARE